MRLGILTRYVLVAPLVASTLIACTRAREDRIVVTFPGSSAGAEADVLRRQLDDFMLAHPEIRVVQRQTPDLADQRHQLYVQWLNAGADDPDILQLDVVWIAEFAAAGWIRALDDFAPEIGDFVPATIVANRWQGRLYALPWFVDVGMLYWRTDLLPHAPATFEELSDQVLQARAQGSGFPQPHYGLVWQGARYEGLVTVFLEYLGAFGGRIVDESGRVIVDSPAARRALETMRAALNEGVVPTVALTWHEEESRLAFQNGQALLTTAPAAGASSGRSPCPRCARRSWWPSSSEPSMPFGSSI